MKRDRVKSGLLGSGGREATDGTAAVLWFQVENARGTEGGGHNSDYKATMSFGVSGSGGMKSIVFVGFYKAAAKTTL